MIQLNDFSDIDKIFNSYKTKFDYMDDLGVIKSIKENNVRVFIDLDMVMKYIVENIDMNCIKILGENNDKDVTLCIISNIINLAQHYRLYFLKYKKECQVYLYCKNIEKGHLNYNGLLNNAIDFIQTLYKFIEKVYIVNYNSNIDRIIVPYVIYKNTEDIFSNLIVSDDKLDYQYIKYGFGVIRPLGKKSYFVNENNIFEKLRGTTKVDISRMSNNFISILLSMISTDEAFYSITGYGPNKAISIINNGLDNHLITGNSNNISLLSSILPDTIKDKVLYNYKLLDVETVYSSIATPVIIHSVLVGKEDKYDRNSLNVINEKYFSKFPIMVLNDSWEQNFNNSI